MYSAEQPLTLKANCPFYFYDLSLESFDLGNLSLFYSLPLHDGL